MKNILKSILIVTMCIFTSCTEEIIDTLNLSIYQHSFNSDDTTPIEVSVYADKGWEYSKTDSWINVEKNDDVLLVSVEANVGGVDRMGKIEVISGVTTKEITIYQLENQYQGGYFGFPVNAEGVMSRNGKYFAYSAPGTELNSRVFALVNAVTGEKTDLPSVKLATGDNYLAVTHLSDDGRVVVYDNSMAVRSTVIVDGVEQEIKVLHELGKWSMLSIQGMSADGKIMVGFYNDKDNITRNVKWVNGEPTLLETPEVDIFGQGHWSGSSVIVYVRGCSDDGSVIYGSDWQSYGIVLWKNDEMIYLGEDFAEFEGEGTEKRATTVYQDTGDNKCLSPDGRYLVCSYGKVAGSGFTPETQYPAYIDLTTMKLTVLDEMSGYRFVTATNQGLFIKKSSSTADKQTFIYDVNTGKEELSTDWIKNEFKVDVLPNTFVYNIGTDNNSAYGVYIQASGMGVFPSNWAVRKL